MTKKETETYIKGLTKQYVKEKDKAKQFRIKEELRKWSYLQTRLTTIFKDYDISHINAEREITFYSCDTQIDFTKNSCII